VTIICEIVRGAEPTISVVAEIRHFVMLMQRELATTAFSAPQRGMR
jgi:hypothetical protein